MPSQESELPILDEAFKEQWKRLFHDYTNDAHVKGATALNEFMTELSRLRECRRKVEAEIT